MSHVNIRLLIVARFEKFRIGLCIKPIEFTARKETNYCRKSEKRLHNRLLGEKSLTEYLAKLCLQIYTKQMSTVSFTFISKTCPGKFKVKLHDITYPLQV